MSSKTIAGRPVIGEVSRSYRSLPDQRPIEDFVAVLDSVFAHPEVEAVRWNQSTPGWNDGDPCTFGTGEFEAKLAGVEEGGEREDGFLSAYYVNQHFSKIDGKEYSYRSNDYPIATAIRALDRADVYYNALEEAFGDPAEITATREGFHVEDYEESY